MKKNYAVLTPVDLDGKRFEPGEVITLEDAAASSLLGVNAIEESATASVAPVVPTDPAERQAAIIAAIEQLDPDNVDVWLRDGKPDASAIAEITGWPVSAVERNAAWGKIKPGA